MNQQSLPELISQCQELLSEICQHPEYKALDYHPDVTLGDATQALNELNWSIDCRLQRVDCRLINQFLSE